MWKNTLFVLLAIMIALFAYTIWGFLSINLQQSQNITITSPEIPQDSTEKTESTSDTINANKEDVVTDKTSAFFISPEDCKNECESFATGTEGWQYCANICGIIPIEKPVTDCSEEKGLARDYCLRDTAISEEHVDLCDEISDRAIADQCRNRIAENIIDASF